MGKLNIISSVSSMSNGYESQWTTVKCDVRVRVPVSRGIEFGPNLVEALSDLAAQSEQRKRKIVGYI